MTTVRYTTIAGAEATLEGELYYVPSWPNPEETFIHFMPFTLVTRPGGSGGQGLKVFYSREETQFFRDLNIPPVQQWAIKDSEGSLFYTWWKDPALYKRLIATPDGELDEQRTFKESNLKPRTWQQASIIRWVPVSLTGPLVRGRGNMVLVTEDDSSYVHLQGIPEDALLDPHRLNHATHPWWVHQINIPYPRRPGGFGDPKGPGYMAIHGDWWMERRQHGVEISAVPDEDLGEQPPSDFPYYVTMLSRQQIKQRPNADGKVDIAERGERIMVVGRDGDWLFIIRGNTRGYVRESDTVRKDGD